MIVPGSPEIQGQVVDDRTRCTHWDGPRDIVALRFKCCGGWYPCRACHDEAVDHEVEVWGPGERDEHAVLCGACWATMTIEAYVASGHACPSCGAGFNPGCQAHWELYFQRS